MKEDIFNTISNDNTAYWLGFLAADGSIHKNKNLIQIGLAQRDREHLEKFAQFLEVPIDKIYDLNVECTNNHKSYLSSYLSIYNKQIKEDLIKKYLISPNKSHQNIDFLEYIPEQYKIAFILGYFDGDGNFTNTENTILFGFCGNQALITTIHNYLHNYFPNWDSVEKVYQYSNSSITYYFNITKHKEILDFCNLYLSYSDKCDLLERKLNTASNIKDKLLLKQEAIEAQQQLKQDVKIKVCPVCQKSFIGRPDAIYCSQICVHIAQRISERPSREELKILIRTKSFLEIGRLYGVSDNAIRKWCKAENLPSKKTDIKRISDAKWADI